MTDHDARRLATQPGESEKEVLQRLRQLNLHKGWVEVEGTDSEPQPKEEKEKEKQSNATAKASTLQPLPLRTSTPRISPVDSTLTEMLRKVVKRTTEEEKKDDKKMDVEAGEANKTESTLQPQSTQVQEDESETKDWEADFDDEEPILEDGPEAAKEVISSQSTSTTQRDASNKINPNKRTKPELGRKDLLKIAEAETSDPEAVNPGPIKPLGASAKKRASSRPPSKSMKGATEARQSSTHSTHSTHATHTDWLGIHSKKEFLTACEAAFRIDGGSAEGFNTHLALYYYASEDWGLPHPLQLKSCVMLRDSTRSKRWCCWICPAPSGSSKGEKLSFKTASAQESHWWQCHSTQPCWDFCRQGHDLGLNAADLSSAILGIDIKMMPLPAGASIKMLPDTLPSHPKGHNTRIFNDPWFKRVTPSTHESEKDLPWRAAEQRVLAVQPKKAPTPPAGKPTTIELTGWGWPIFWDKMTRDNGDISRMLLYPAAGISAYAGDRQKWHSSHSTLSSVAFTSAMVDCEQHALLILLLKLVVTKGAAKQVGASQLYDAKGLLATWESKLHEGLVTTMSKHQPVPPSALYYAQSVEEYVLSVFKLEVPVNPWLVPYPAQHSGGFRALINDAVPKITA